MNGSTRAKTLRDLALALARARQEERAARLLVRGGHRAEALKLALRALDSAFWASQLAGGRNEPADALEALGLGPADVLRALEVLRRARTLELVELDAQLDRAAGTLTHEALRVTGELLGAVDAREPGLVRARVSVGRALVAWLRLQWPQPFATSLRLPRETS
jgi:hypothetical protein